MGVAIVITTSVGSSVGWWLWLAGAGCDAQGIHGIGHFRLIYPEGVKVNRMLWFLVAASQRVRVGRTHQELARRDVNLNHAIF
jgi:hypothetical protein